MTAEGVDEARDVGSAPGTEAKAPLLREVYPDLCTELIGLLNADGHYDLGICANDLRIVAPCGCGDDFCQSYYTAPRPIGAYGPGHSNVSVLPEHGMIVLDVVDGVIMFVEVVGHPPLRDAAEEPPSS